MSTAKNTAPTSAVRLIEQAMVQRLKLVQESFGVAIESYGAQLDDELFAWVRTLPAQWVTFDAVTAVKKVGKRSWQYSATFEVLSAQRHLQDNERRLAGAEAGLSMGAYELIERAKLALTEQKLGLAIQPLQPGAVRSVMKGQASRDAVAIYAQQFKTEWIEELPHEALTPDGELISVGLEYRLKPGDELTDTSDLVTTQT